MKQSIQLNHGQKAIPTIGLGVFNKSRREFSLL